MTIRAYNKAPSPQIPGGEQEYVDRELNKLKQTTDDVISNAGTLAPIDSPVFTGTPKAPTPATADSSTLLATTQWVKAQGYATPVSSLTMSGDVTGTTSSNTIAANKVTYPKFQQVSAGMLLGNSGASAANVGELTPSQALDLIGTTRGSILYRGASGWSVLPPGTSGQFLKTNGAGADPAFATVTIPPQPIFAYAKGSFNGTTSAFTALTGVGGTISRVGQGTFRLTFASAQPDTNYVTMALWGNGSTFPGICEESNRTVNSVDIMIYQNNTTGTQADAISGQTTTINIMCLR